ncbi:MAG: TlpA disulfide reductase family protein [Deferrisomatales bacterium]|nr:TlpA disulfide reductase family protein [Deferrisomatales bacterium]
MKRVKLWQVVLVWAVLVAVPAMAGGGEEGDEWLGKPAPAFALKDLDGNALNLAELGGKVVWLNFWGLRCGPCVRELPALQKIHQEYADKGLLIIGVNADGVDSEFIRKQFASRDDLKNVGVTFPLAPDEEFGAIDTYGLMGAPLNVMIDQEGVIRFRHEGYEDGDEVHYLEVVQKLLAR